MRVLLISGSTRAASTNTALVRTAAAYPPPGVNTVHYPDIAHLPHFNPDDDHEPLPPAVAELRAAVGAADAVLFCTPEYAGTLPGSFKNLLDWLVGGTEINGKRVGWVRVTPDEQRGLGAHQALETVLGYVQADLVEDACVWVPVARTDVGADGLVADAAKRAQITAALAALLTPR